MKKILLTAVAALAMAPVLSAQGTSSTVLMTVDGKDIHVSEFEYLYNKNNNQQAQQQTLDEYLDMFTVYKLKVAEAENAGLDLTDNFVNEYNKFRSELAAPYFIDKDVLNQVVEESFSHRTRNIVVSHIMMQGSNSKAMLDSLRNTILEGKITFEDAAKQFSIDKPSAARGGLMGPVPYDRFPWSFEKAAYATEVGQISPVINSGMGFHIIRVESSEPSQGEVNASHILLLTRDMDAAGVARQKALADSIYNAVVAGADFAEAAKKHSQDPGSANKGGSLGWFGRGMMVAEFDSISFAIADGEISKPFSTRFGFHIIKRHSHRLPEFNETTRKDIMAKMARDERGKLPAQAFTDKLMKQYNATLNNDVINEVCIAIKNNAGKLDSALIASINANSKIAGTFDGDNITTSEIVARIPKLPANATKVDEIFRNTAKATLENAVLDIERNKLATTNADYRNLLNEYRDGILLYEISNSRVWEKASKDSEGLEAFFHKNIAKYSWEQPKFKSYIFFADNDSILDAAIAHAEKYKNKNASDFMNAMRAKFGNKLKVERVIAAKGENPITDFLAFGGEKPKTNAKQKRWTNYVAYNGRIIDAPEEAADVRGAAVTDYQALLEQEWVKQLRKKYKVKLNKKVFKQLKQSREK